MSDGNTTSKRKLEAPTNPTPLVFPSLSPQPLIHITGNGNTISLNNSGSNQHFTVHHHSAPAGSSPPSHSEPSPPPTNRHGTGGQRSGTIISSRLSTSFSAALASAATRLPGASGFAAASRVCVASLSHQLLFPAAVLVDEPRATHKRKRARLVTLANVSEGAAVEQNASRCDEEVALSDASRREERRRERRSADVSRRRAIERGWYDHDHTLQHPEWPTTAMQQYQSTAECTRGRTASRIAVVVHVPRQWRTVSSLAAFERVGGVTLPPPLITAVYGEVRGRKATAWPCRERRGGCEWLTAQRGRWSCHPSACAA